MNRSARFWDRMARRYSKTPIKDEASYERKLAQTREHLRAEHQLLELGCGTGGTALRHAPSVDKITAVDYSNEMLDIARERAAAAGVENIEFLCASLESLTAEAGSFDVVLALSLLHLVDDRDDALARIFAWLKPGGVFVSSTACLAEHHGFLRYIKPVAQRIGLFPSLEIFSVEALRGSIETAGFVIEDLWLQGHNRPHVAFCVARRPPLESSADEDFRQGSGGPGEGR